MRITFLGRLSHLCVGFFMVSVSSTTFGASLQLAPKHVFEAVAKNDVGLCKKFNNQVNTVLNGDGNTPLHMAILFGHETICRVLIEKGTNLEQRNNKGETPLHWASSGGHSVLCELLIEKGVNVNVQDDSGWTPLHWGSRKEQEKVCNVLVEKGADLEVRDNSGNTPLDVARHEQGGVISRLLADRPKDIFGAIEKGDIDSVRKFSNQVNFQNNEGNTPLHRASWYGHYELCKFLIGEAVDLNAQNNDGDTPLHKATGTCKKQVCELLIYHGASINVQNNLGLTPLHKAIQYGQKTLWKLFVEKSANINAQDGDGNTALHASCERGHIDLCALLLKRNADINIQNHTGATPLMLCCKEGNSDIFRLLSKRDDLIKERRDTSIKGSALDWACEYNHILFCKELVKKGFNVHPKPRATSLLHRACRNNNRELVEYFLELQVSVNAQNAEGNTPLHLACLEGYSDLVQHLLEVSAERSIDINIKNTSGKTSLHCAVELGRKRVVDHLLAHSALPNEKDVFNKTPIMYAVEKEQLEIVKLLMQGIAPLEFNAVKQHLVSLTRSRKNTELQSLLDGYEHLPPLKTAAAAGSTHNDENRPHVDAQSASSIPQVGDYSAANLYSHEKEDVESDVQSTIESLNQVSIASDQGLD